MNENRGWSAVMSPKSMKVLSTSFVEYFRQQFVRDFGEEFTRRVMNFAYQFMTDMDEGRNPQTELEKDLDAIMYPMLGFYRGFQREGVDPVTAMRYLEAALDAAPAGIKARPWAEE